MNKTELVKNPACALRLRTGKLGIRGLFNLELAFLLPLISLIFTNRDTISLAFTVSLLVKIRVIRGLPLRSKCTDKMNFSIKSILNAD